MASVLAGIERATRADQVDPLDADLADIEDQFYSTERLDGLETRSRERRSQRLAARRRAA